MIDIRQEDFGTLCICALRYCHGRKTYMPSLVQSIVMSHFKDLSDRDLKVIADDERFQTDMNLWGDHCDLVDWKNFYQTLREWQSRKEQLVDVYSVGEYIIYRNGEKYELGRIKSLEEDGAFVAYHEGETGAKTPYSHMHKLINRHCIVDTTLGGDYFKWLSGKE